MAYRFRTIVHPTDFSDASAEAFSHALRIALAMKGKLLLVHIGDLRYVHERDRFPSVRQTLEQWRLLDEDDRPTAVGEKLGIEVETVRLEPQDPVRGLLRFLDTHPSDLIVLATHGLDGVARWLYGSMAETLSRKIRLPTLFVPAAACGFVDQTTGKLRLSRVLVPVDQSPPPETALGIIREFISPMREEGTAIELMHVGENGPLTVADGTIVRVVARRGDVVETILKEAKEQQVDLIAMPTAGHHGLLDALRGSTAERVLRHAPCPVLAIPTDAATV
jgi:nucleotide-binding universal stress UspA family protein